MLKTYKYIVLLFVLFSLVGCEGEGWENFAATPTPVVKDLPTQLSPTADGVVEDVPSATVLPLPTATDHPDPSPTAICSSEEECYFPSIAVTPLGDVSWEYTVKRYYKVRCVARDGDDNELACNVRSRPVVTPETFSYSVPFGTTFDVLALYHCETYSYCDVEVADWYFTTSKEWLVVIDTVWEDVTPYPDR